MQIQTLDQLHDRIETMIDLVQRLKDENSQLKDKNQQLETQMQEMRLSFEQIPSKQERLEELERLWDAVQGGTDASVRAAMPRSPHFAPTPRHLTPDDFR